MRCLTTTQRSFRWRTFSGALERFDAIWEEENPDMPIEIYRQRCIRAMKLGSSDEIGAVGGANLAKGRVTLIVAPVSSEVSNPIVPPRVLAMSFAEYAPRPVPPCFSAVANFSKACSERTPDTSHSVRADQAPRVVSQQAAPRKTASAGSGCLRQARRGW